MSSSASSSYRRVAQRETSDATAPGAPPDSGNGGFGSPRSTPTTTTRSRAERLEDKFVALGFIALAFLLARWTNFYPIVWRDPRLSRILLRVAGVGFAIVVSLFLYLTLYLPKILGLSDPSVWPVYCPKVLPTMYAMAFLTYMVFIRAIFPIWGMWAPVLSGTQIMGILMSTHFIPTFGLC